MKCSSRKKLFHSSALFSLFWSAFYCTRVIIFALTSYPNLTEVQKLECVQWLVAECLLSGIGILLSLSLFSSYRKNGASLVAFSWLSWMFSNFMISLLLIHKSLFELLSGSAPMAILFNDVIDLAHLFNAPSTIYFILVFVSGYFGKSTNPAGNLLFGEMRTPFGYKKLDKFEVLQTHDEYSDEDVVHFV